MESFQPEPFGKYWLIDRIAMGGMAEIFCARTFAHGGFSNLFVIKRILPHLGEEASFVEMFVAEAKVSVALQHPNIVRVYDFGREGEHFFIAMEHVDGRDLRKALQGAARQNKPFPLAFALYVVLQACKGLQHAHTRSGPDGGPLGIVHRDISPSNLLLSFDGDVKVADFGIARNMFAEEEDGAIKGKYEYMSPEQAMGEPVDARSDLFALGTVLYELVTRKRAFKGADDGETLRRVVKAEITPVRDVVPSTPDAVVALIDKALALDPSKRFASARDMADALRAALPEPEEAIHEQLAAWLRSVFAEERASDRLRLEAATETARQMHDQAEAAGPAADRSQGRLVGMMAALVVGALLLLGGAAWMSGQEVTVPLVAVAATGSLEFDVTPAARVYVSGRQVGEGAVVSVPNLAPGDYDVRLEAEGHRVVAETVRVTRGGATRVRRALESVGDEAPVVAFSTRPQGALVLIDGKAVGKSPMDWLEGEPGRSYEIELRLDGYQTLRGSVSGLEAKQRTSFARNLEAIGGAADAREVARNETVRNPTPPPPRPPTPVPAPPPATRGPGTLKVVLMGGATWATVYVDGKKLDKTAPFSGVSIPAGQHVIKVENPALGLSHIQTVNVAESGAVTVRAQAQ